MSTIKTIGKAKIDLDIRGCIDCGIQWSSGWEIAQVVEVVVAGKVYQGKVHRCADCTRKKAPQIPTLFDLAESEGVRWKKLTR
jgi:hypothetical protein